MFQYDVRIPDETSLPKSINHPDSGSYEVGDAVYVKPLNTKCTGVWQVGRVTKLVSDTAVEVDGTNRHVADIRLASRGRQHDPGSTEIEIVSDGEDGSVEQMEESDGSQDNGDRSEMENERRSQRDRCPPRWLWEFYVDDY